MDNILGVLLAQLVEQGRVVVVRIVSVGTLLEAVERSVAGYNNKYTDKRADLVVSSVTNISVVVNDDFSMADLSLSLPGHVEVRHFSVFCPPGSGQVGHVLRGDLAHGSHHWSPASRDIILPVRITST